MASVITRKSEFEPLSRPLGPSPRASIEKAQKLELKALPTNLKYVFLGNDVILQVILLVGLSNVQVNEALAMFK